MEHAVAVSLEEHAREIRRLGKRVLADVVEIGRHLTEAKKIVGHNRWLPWLQRELGWSSKTAENFMRVYKLSAKFENFSDLGNIPLAVYRLSRKSVSDDVRTVVIERASAGERMTLRQVEEITKRPTLTAVRSEEVAERPAFVIPKVITAGERSILLDQPPTDQPTKHLVPQVEFVERRLRNAIGAAATASALRRSLSRPRPARTVGPSGTTANCTMSSRSRTRWRARSSPFSRLM